jgi:hypothetical protein
MVTIPFHNKKPNGWRKEDPRRSATRAGPERPRRVISRSAASCWCRRTAKAVATAAPCAGGAGCGLATSAYAVQEAGRPRSGLLDQPARCWRPPRPVPVAWRNGEVDRVAAEALWDPGPYSRNITSAASRSAGDYEAGAARFTRRHQDRQGRRALRFLSGTACILAGGERRLPGRRFVPEPPNPPAPG